MQCIFVYLPLVYPQFAASLFAGNDAARSFLAFAAVMFGKTFFRRLFNDMFLTLCAKHIRCISEWE